MIKLNINKHGFTIIELLIATAVFASILLLITTGMIEVGRLFYKGATNTNTQETARIIIEDISQAIQFNGEGFTPPTPAEPNRFCVGSRRYTFARGVKLTKSNHIILIDKFATTCNDSTPGNNLVFPVANSRELMGINMRLADITVTPGANETYIIKVRVVYGDDDLLEDPTGIGARCRQDIRSGTQFCGVSELNTTVKRRVE